MRLFGFGGRDKGMPSINPDNYQDANTFVPGSHLERDRTDNGLDPALRQNIQELLKNPNLTDEQRQALLEQQDQIVEQVNNTGFMGTKMGKATAFFGGMATGMAKSYLVKQGLLRAIGGVKSFGASVAVGAATGAIVGGGSKFVHEFRHRHDAERYQEFLNGSEEEKVIRACIVIRDIDREKVKGSTALLREIAVTELRNHFKETTDPEIRVQRFEEILATGSISEEEMAAESPETKALLERLLNTKVKGPGMRKKEIFMATVKGALYGAAGAAVGYAISHALGWESGHSGQHADANAAKGATAGSNGPGSSHPAGSNVENGGGAAGGTNHSGVENAAAAKGAAAAKAAETVKEETLKMHKTVEQTVRHLLKHDPNHQISQELLHDKKFMAQAVNEFTKHLAAENKIEIVAHHAHPGHLHVDHPSHLDTKMAEGTVLHHVEKVRDFLKGFAKHYQESHAHGGGHVDHTGHPDGHTGHTGTEHHDSGQHTQAGSTEQQPQHTGENPQHTGDRPQHTGGEKPSAGTPDNKQPNAAATPTKTVPHETSKNPNIANKSEVKGVPKWYQYPETWLLGVMTVGGGALAYKAGKIIYGDREDFKQSFGEFRSEMADRVRNQIQRLKNWRKGGDGQNETEAEEQLDPAEQQERENARDVLLGERGPLNKLVKEKFITEAQWRTIQERVREGTTINPVDAVRGILDYLMDATKDRMVTGDASRAITDFLGFLRKAFGRDHYYQALDEMEHRGIGWMQKAKASKGRRN